MNRSRIGDGLRETVALLICSGPHALDRAPGQLHPHPVSFDVRCPVATVKTLQDSAVPTPVISPPLTTLDGLILDL